MIGKTKKCVQTYIHSDEVQREDTFSKNRNALVTIVNTSNNNIGVIWYSDIGLVGGSKGMKFGIVVLNSN